jgi:Flp pilus assembly secretin CpaC
MKRYKFEMGGSYIYFFGNSLGEAIVAFMKQRANRVAEIESITEEPIRDFEKP